MIRRLLVVCLALTFVAALMPLAATPAAAADPPLGQVVDEVFFEQTGHHVRGAFLRYWESRGGLDIFGFPITEELDFHGTTVQYFQRARFEWHPDNPQNFQVLLGRVGVEVSDRNDNPAFRSPVPKGYQYRNTADHLYFPQTGHFLSYGFKQFWEQRGGLDIYGYPISEEFSEVNPADGQTYTVQYFERARFEYHPEHAGTKYEVELGLLGWQIASRIQAPQGAVARNPGVPVWPNVTQLPAKWIEVDLNRPQQLTAWEGNTPVFTTTVSAGLDQYPTPLGVFTIQYKLRYDDMTGGRAGAADYYYLPDVPFVMYFYTGGYAMHGTYWHSDFGGPKSRGCINLTIPAAEWIYNWAPVGTPIWIHGNSHVWR